MMAETETGSSPSFQYKKFKNDGDANNASSATSPEATRANGVASGAENATAQSRDDADAAAINESTSDTVTIIVKDPERPTANSSQPKQPSTRVDPDEQWRWMTLILSTVSLFFCGVVGIFATVLAILSYVDHRVKDVEGSQRKGRAAFILSIIGIVAGTVLLIVAAIVIGVFA